MILANHKCTCSSAPLGFCKVAQIITFTLTVQSVGTDILLAAEKSSQCTEL